MTIQTYFTTKPTDSGNGKPKRVIVSDSREDFKVNTNLIDTPYNSSMVSVITEPGSIMRQNSSREGNNILVEPSKRASSLLELRNSRVSANRLIDDLIKKGVTILNYNKVIDYLSKNNQINSCIFNACIDIAAQVKNDTRIYLDFEEDLPNGYILLNVRQNPYQDNLLEILFEIGYKYIDLTKKLDGKFRIITDYQNI